jgi:hypothetical protein
MHSKFVGLAAVSAGALAAAVVAVAATQQTLTGESFLQGGGTTVNTCSSDGGSAAFDFTGAATGPYPGTYSAHLVVRYAAAAGGVSSLTGAETFVVASGTTSISGTKDVVGTLQCVGGEFSMAISGTYTASISASGATFNDHGTWTGSVQTPLGLAELFASDVTVPVPTLPTDKDQCKKNGWQSFGIFKNQGDCVSAVATNGKNQPTG